MLKVKNKYKLICGDVLEVLKDFPSGHFDLIVTDPPYRTTPRGSCGTSGGMLKKDINLKGRVFKYNDIDIEEYLPVLYRVLKSQGHCYIMCNHRNLKHFLDVIYDFKSSDGGKFTFIKSLIWDKGNKICGTAYMSQFEYILFLRKGRFKPINYCGTSELISIPNIKHKKPNGQNYHDTEKPVELFKTLIKNSSNKGDIVLDPFCGIAPSAIACKELNRKFVGIDIDSNYINIAKEFLKGNI